MVETDKEGNVVGRIAHNKLLVVTVKNGVPQKRAKRTPVLPVCEERRRMRQAERGIHKASGHVCVCAYVPSEIAAAPWLLRLQLSNSFHPLRQGAELRRRSQIVDLLAICCWTPRFMGESTEREYKQSKRSRKRREKWEAWELSTGDSSDSLYNFLEVLNEDTKESKASQVCSSSLSSSLIIIK